MVVVVVVLVVVVVVVVVVVAVAGAGAGPVAVAAAAAAALVVAIVAVFVPPLLWKRVAQTAWVGQDFDARLRFLPGALARAAPNHKTNLPKCAASFRFMVFYFDLQKLV